MAQITRYALNSDNRVESDSAVWATAMAGADFSLKTVTDMNAYTGTKLDGNYWCSEYFLAFDTTAIPVGSTITDVSLTMYCGAETTADVTIEVFAYDWGAAVGTSDWRTGGAAGQLAALYDSGNGLCASLACTSADPTWMDPVAPFVVNDSAMFDAIVADGTNYTKFVMASNLMRSDTAADSTARVNWATGDDTTESHRPTLVIDYTAPVAWTGVIITRLVQS